MFSVENLTCLNMVVGTILAVSVVYREYYPEEFRRNAIVRYTCKYSALVYLIIVICSRICLKLY